MTPETLWHITGRRNTESICKQGLLTDATGFDFCYIWGFSDLSTAQQSAHNSWGGSLGDNVIFEIDVSGLEVIPDPHPG